jgi:hypothetical protein
LGLRIVLPADAIASAPSKDKLSENELSSEELEMLSKLPFLGN